MHLSHFLYVRGYTMEQMEHSHKDADFDKCMACDTLEQKFISFTNRQSHASKPKEVTYLHDCVPNGYIAAKFAHNQP